MHIGLQKLFRNLSIASIKVQNRQEARDKLQGYLRKIKIVSSQTAKKSVISSEIQKLENHLSDLLDKRFKALRQGPSLTEKSEMEKLKHKEEEFNMKIAKLNELLAKVGKKIDEGELKQQLEEEIKEEPTSLIEQLEDRLYLLESKYHEMSENPKIPVDVLDKIKDKISELKEKIREQKNR